MDVHTLCPVRAIEYLGATGVVLDSADILARAVVEALSVGQGTVVIDFDGMPAVSSSFFNLLFRRVIDARTKDDLDRVKLLTQSPLLAILFERSRNAVRHLD